MSYFIILHIKECTVNLLPYIHCLCVIYKHVYNIIGNFVVEQISVYFSGWFGNSKIKTNMTKKVYNL